MPLHPGLVHYPIALLVQSTVFQALFLIYRHDWLSKAALITWGSALLGAIAAAITGTAQEESIQIIGGVAEILARHEQLANLTIFVSLAGLLYSFVGFMRNNLNPWITFTILLVLSGSVLITGHLGGQLVFLHGTGVTPQ